MLLKSSLLNYFQIVQSNSFVPIQNLAEIKMTFHIFHFIQINSHCDLCCRSKRSVNVVITLTAIKLNQQKPPPETVHEILLISLFALKATRRLLQTRFKRVHRRRRRPFPPLPRARARAVNLHKFRERNVKLAEF